MSEDIIKIADKLRENESLSVDVRIKIGYLEGNFLKAEIELRKYILDLVGK